MEVGLSPAFSKRRGRLCKQSIDINQPPADPGDQVPVFISSIPIARTITAGLSESRLASSLPGLPIPETEIPRVLTVLYTGAQISPRGTIATLTTYLAQVDFKSLSSLCFQFLHSISPAVLEAEVVERKIEEPMMMAQLPD